MSMTPWLPDHVKILHDAHVEHLKELRAVGRRRPRPQPPRPN
jgi:hypothetical protein